MTDTHPQYPSEEDEDIAYMSTEQVVLLALEGHGEKRLRARHFLGHKMPRRRWQDIMEIERVNRLASKRRAAHTRREALKMKRRMKNGYQMTTPSCRHCGQDTALHGYTSAGNRRLRCKACGKTMTE